MKITRSLVVTALLLPAAAVCAQEEAAVPSSPVSAPARWWPETVEAAIAPSGDNRAELIKALTEVPEARREGMKFLIENMPSVDLRSLKAAFLLDHVAMGYEARAQAPWGQDIPADIFLNDVLAYASLNEKRDGSRRKLRELALPLVKDCKTPGEAGAALNRRLFEITNVKYSTKRKKPDQSPSESMESGLATCSGLSIMLVDACRAVGVPARVAGTPMWTNLRGNHTWVEIWDKKWHFTGACEPDEKGLDRGWFTGDAAKALANVPEHAIYASSFKKTGTSFPLVWDETLDWVNAVNVTERYAPAEKPALPAGKAHLLIRVLAKAGGPRVAAKVSVSEPSNAAFHQEGVSRDETADLNNILPVPVENGHVYTVTVESGGKTVKKEITVTADPEQTVTITLEEAPVPPQESSAKAISDLKAWLALDRDQRSALAGNTFASAPLTKTDAATAREALWQDHVKLIRETQAEAMAAKVIEIAGRRMPFEIVDFPGKDGVPPGGRSLFISMHGGGNAPAGVNTAQWKNQVKLAQSYKPDEGLYVAPRAPTDTWNLWHEGHIDGLFERLIENLIVLENVNPDRVYLMGYSAGGDGVYQLAPRMADHLAAAAMSAGHPNEASPLSLRNLPFAIQVGEKDGAYKRNDVAAEWGKKLDALRATDPAGYEHFTDLPAGKPHWMGMEDRKAIPWMEKFTRQPLPEKIVWHQDDVTHDRFYWLAVPAGKAAKGTGITATRAAQTVTLSSADVPEVTVLLNDDLVDLDQPVTVKSGDKVLFTGSVPRTVSLLRQTLAERGDPRLVFSGSVTVKPDGV
ncbi:MAG: transglutaminase domain-containing protein [Verrucomicrobiota bacterium]